MMLLLLMVACWPVNCDDYVGATREQVRERLRHRPGETGRPTFQDDGHSLRVHIENIPDDAVASRDMALKFASDTAGVERVTACKAREVCARGLGWSNCP